MLEEYGIQLVKIDLPFRLNHVNCFLAEGENGFQVIDTGLHNKSTAERWEKELDGKTVTNIIITHYHPDHFGYAGGLQKKTAAKRSRQYLSLSKNPRFQQAKTWVLMILG